MPLRAQANFINPDKQGLHYQAIWGNRLLDELNEASLGWIATPWGRKDRRRNPLTIERAARLLRCKPFTRGAGRATRARCASKGSVKAHGGRPCARGVVVINGILRA